MQQVLEDLKKDETDKAGVSHGFKNVDTALHSVFGGTATALCGYTVSGNGEFRKSAPSRPKCPECVNLALIERDMRS